MISKVFSGISLMQALALSLLVHLLLLLPWGLLQLRPAPPEVQQQRLLLEVYGMISDRQTDAQQQGDLPLEAQVAAPSAEPTPAQEAAPPAPPPLPQVEDMPPPPEQAQTESPVVVELPEPVPDTPPPQPQVQPRQAVQAVAASQTAPALSPRPPGAEASQQQQTISREELEASLVREYLRHLRRTVQGNLVYPTMARWRGYEGTPTVSFVITEEGGIEEGTLRITRSSGYPELDEAALQATRVSVPFERPHRSMNVSIAVSFRRD